MSEERRSGTVTTWRYAALAIGAMACESVSDSDPGLWNQTNDLGGQQFQVPPAGSAGGAAPGGAPNTGSVTSVGGRYVPPPQGGSAGMAFPGAGGATSSFGGTPVGAGGFIPQGSGGFTPSAGGFVSAAGGMIVGSGGMMPPGMGGGPASGGATGNSGKCTMTFDVTTVTAKGRYAPNNAGAVWITDAQNKFVKTLRTWSILELQQVTAWVQATNRNTVDAVTGATRRSHGPLDQTKWDCTDVMHAAVPDGQYILHVSFAESDANIFAPAPGIQASVNFTKSSAGADVMGMDTANFTMMHVKLTSP